MTESLSVVMATFNGEAFLREQLESIATQTVQPDEVLVGDDGSTDGTLNILEEFALNGRLPLKVEQNPQRLGSTKNFERLMLRAQGDAVVFSDQDDVWMPDRLEQTRAALAGNSQANYVFSDAEIVDSTGGLTGRTLFESAYFSRREQARFSTGEGWHVLLRRNVVTGATLAIRKRAAALVMPIPDGWVHDAWIAWMLEATSTGLLLDRPLIKYRRHGQQQIGVVAGGLRGLVAWLGKPRAQAFEEEAFAYERLHERLSNQVPRPAGEVLGALHGKAAFLRRRAALVRSRVGRVQGVVSAGASSDYQKYALGWRSLAVDAASFR